MHPDLMAEMGRIQMAEREKYLAQQRLLALARQAQPQRPLWPASLLARLWRQLRRQAVPAAVAVSPAGPAVAAAACCRPCAPRSVACC